MAAAVAVAGLCENHWANERPSGLQEGRMLRTTAAEAIPTTHSHKAREAGKGSRRADMNVIRANTPKIAWPGKAKADR